MPPTIYKSAAPRKTPRTDDRGDLQEEEGVELFVEGGGVVVGGTEDGEG